MREICQNDLPVKPWMEEKMRRLPGLQPIAQGEWLQVDEAYADQMAYREFLLDQGRNDVFRQMESAAPAARELLERILEELKAKQGFSVEEGEVSCPDGRRVKLDEEHPLISAARLTQEDLVLMERQGDEHVMTAAVLCFPASWSLEQKFGGGLMGIHVPVEAYTEDIGRRVQRLFDFIKVDLPMWRANFLVYSDPELHQPRREENRRSVQKDGKLWVRVERQSLVKLPISEAVVFSIHTYVVPTNKLSVAERQELFLIKQIDRAP